MARVRSRNTEAEFILRRALWRHGLRYRLHVKLPGSPDLAFVRAKVAVFVDGCFWHACPGHYRAPVQNADFWRHKIQQNIARDRRVDGELATLGWIVVRVWEHELRGDLEGAVRIISDAIGRYGGD